MNEFAHQFDINKSTACLISSRYPQANNVRRKPGSVRSRKFTTRQYRQMVKLRKLENDKSY